MTERTTDVTVADIQRGHRMLTAVLDNVERVIVGKRAAAARMLCSLICRGHVLVEDVPGVGKTTIVRAMSVSVGCDFRRIQFTPDLLPSDITGVSVYDQNAGEFTFQPGPIFGQVILADEINRTSPKTQSSLLECMEEGQVTIDGVPRRLPEPFIVMATQNPIEYEGTFPLPEAQLDRFLVRVAIGYPSLIEEREILSAQTHRHPIQTLEAVLEPRDVLWLQELVTWVRVEDTIRDYIVQIVQASRRHDDVYLGASPRGALAVFRMARATALLDGRDYVVPDDVKQVAVAALAHRILLKPESSLRGRSAEDTVADLMHRTPAPTGLSPQ